MWCHTEYSNSAVSVFDRREHVHPCAGECGPRCWRCVGRPGRCRRR
jgi:hypothetical protein